MAMGISPEYDGVVLACRPDDLAKAAVRMGIPVESFDGLAPLDPGWVVDECAMCHEAVRVGIRQQGQRRLVELEYPDKGVTLLCIICAMWVQGVRNELGNPMPVSHLGGA